MYCIDSSAYIALCIERYPNIIFPSLYEELRKEFSEKVKVIKPIYDEIKYAYKKQNKEEEEEFPLKWLNENMSDSKSEKIDDEVREIAKNIENRYETQKGVKGAGPVDVKLIAYAKKNKYIVITEEAKQQEPKEKYNYKIPLICEKEKVECVSLLEFFKILKIQI